MNKIIKNKKLFFIKSLGIFLFLILLGAYANIFAIGSPYTPGEILDPACLPGEANCTVVDSSASIQTKLGASSTSTAGYLSSTDWNTFNNKVSSQWITSGNNISYNSGNVGIGTSTPSASLEIKLGALFSGNGSYDSDTSVFNPSTAVYSQDNSGVTGINDAEFSGEYTGDYNNYIYVEIDGTDPDTFYYSDDQGDCYGNAIIDGTIQEICNGISITFGSTIGHTLGDNWSYEISSTVTDDATFSGSYLGGPENNYVYVSIYGTNPDTFSYYDDSGTCTQVDNIPITPGIAQPICFGLSVTFESNTNHSTNDSWSYSVGTYTPTFTNPAFKISDGFKNYFTINAVADNSNFIGVDAGIGAPDASESNFLGYFAGHSATSASNSNFLGFNAGYQATSASNSNFLGNLAGYQATNASNSNFLGELAGHSATSASNSNFLGPSAGYQATNASNSNFLGNLAGHSATSASYSNFLGESAGYSATSASYSNFLGNQAGYSAASAADSNFLGTAAGYQATNASNSIFIGKTAGYQDTVNNTGSTDDFSLLIGPNTNTGGYSNSIALGGYAVNTASNQVSFGSATRPINKLYIAGVDYTLPTSQGAASTVLTNDGSGNLSWNTPADGGGSTPISLDVNDSFILGGGSNSPRSNFIGYKAGENSGYSSDSNFFGYYAGKSAEEAEDSNFLGYETGRSATRAFSSNFLGYSAGYSATDASTSNFLGSQAGYLATNASNSNFLGKSAGNSANSASYSNLFGFQAGKTYTSNNIGSNNIIIGTNISLPNATANAINLGGVLFGTGSYGTTTGDPSITPTSTGSIGVGVVTPTARLQLPAGTASANTAPLKLTSGTNLTTTEAGAIEYNGSHLYFTATNGGTRYQLDQQTASVSLDANDNFILGGGYYGVNQSNFLGSNAGYEATSASNSNFFGNQSGNLAVSATYSNFLGAYAGYGSTYASNSNFLGRQSGYLASGAANSNFFGFFTGYSATNASNSNFLGYSAGYSAGNASNSNFLGSQAGYLATNASNSNFLGYFAGIGATNASNSNFLGNSAGYQATSANDSNFLGYSAGYSATNASNSTFIGKSSGANDTVNNTGDLDDFSILIGPNTNTGGYSNSIALGGYAVNTASYQFKIGSNTRPIVSTVWQGSLTTCTLNTGTGMSCSSDMNLKKNIYTLEDKEWILNTIPTQTSTLSKILSLNPVTYNWNTELDTDSKHTGFIAQEMEQVFPDLVSTDPTTSLKSISYANLTPYIVKSIQEMDLKITDIYSLDTDSDTSLGSLITRFFEEKFVYIKDLTAGILHIDGNVCVDNICITKDQFKTMLINAGGVDSSIAPMVIEDTTITPNIEEPIVTPEVTEVEPAIEPVVEPEIINTPVEEIVNNDIIEEDNNVVSNIIN